MRIEFPQIDDVFIRNQITAGYYHNATELVRDAVRRLRENAEAAQQGRLVAALQRGAAEIDAGKGVSYTETFIEESKERARKNSAAGRKPNPDVLPQI